MSELDVLRDLTDQLRPPDFEELLTVSRKRRRRVAVGVAAATTVAVVAVGITGALLANGDRAIAPAPQPSPTSTTSVEDEGWTPERTRAEGDAVGFLGSAPGPTASGLDAQVYCTGTPVGVGSPCNRYHPYDPREEQHWALEVVQGGRSAVFEVQGTPFATAYDDDALLIADGTDTAPRYRLLRADGTETELRELEEPVSAGPGPEVLLVENLEIYRRGSFGDTPREQPYLVDEAAGTLQPLEVPYEVMWWGDNVDEALWGGTGCRVVFQQPGGEFTHHDLACGDRADDVDPGWNWPGYADWIEPGRMVAVEWRNAGPGILHATTDWGATWQRIEIEKRDWGDTLDEIDRALDEAVGQLD